MRNIINNCYYCNQQTKQTVVVESWLDLSGYNVFIHYWRKCNQCGNLTLEKTKEIDCEQL